MTFDDILAGCIEALEQGATVDECLARHPAEATALEPLLRMVVTLRSEAQTRMSSQAFARGRSALQRRLQQQAFQSASKAVQHRLPPGLEMPSQKSNTHHSTHAQNGAPRRRPSSIVKRSLNTKPSSWGKVMERTLRMALLLVLLLGATSLTRRIISSLPGTFFYPIKNIGVLGVGVLMQAAGEEIPWHATQAEDRLRQLAQLPQSDAATVQALVKVIEEHWESVLTATQRLPVAERIAVLQTRITRLQQIEADWASPQSNISPTAVLTVRKMISHGEQVLAASQPVATAVPTASLTPIPTTVLTIVPTAQPTATPLLQATLTLTRSPVLVGTATPEATTVDLSIPATATPSPTLLVTAPPTTTPIPVLTAPVMPLQESNHQESNRQEPTVETASNQSSDDGDKDKNNSIASEQAVSGPETGLENNLTAEATDSTTEGTVESEATLQTPESVITVDATVIAPVALTADPTIETLSVTPVIGEPPTTPEESTEKNPEEDESPVATAVVESASPTLTTPELLKTETPRPTHQPSATKTPKPTTTPDKPAGTTPVATPLEKTPKPNAQSTETTPSASTPPSTPQSITP